MRLAITILLLSVMLLARENPFVPVPKEPPTEKNLSHQQSTSSAEKQEARSDETEQILNYQHIRFIVNKGTIRIETKDELLKHFAIQRPTRIVMDFKSNADFRTQHAALNASPFRVLRIGLHEGFYRVVIELDSPRHYDLSAHRYGHILKMH